MECPFCGTELPENAQECNRCDWVRPVMRDESKHLRDLAAIWLSLAPGLGHLYKGHVILGGLIFFIIGPGVLAMSLVVAPATLGVSLLILPLFLGAVMLHAYHIDDVRARVIEQARQLDQA
jgi:hypothetical protein